MSAPSSATTNQMVTLTATVSAQSGGPEGAVTFYANGGAISGCSLGVAPSEPTARCQTSFAADDSPTTVTAQYVPYPFANQSPSSSAPIVITIAKGDTTQSLALSKTSIPVGGSVEYTATISSSPSGPVSPAGLVEFLDDGYVIQTCGVEQLSSEGTAQCAVRYVFPGRHHISVYYTGDADFLTATSGSTLLSVGQPAGTVNATMQWTFLYTPKSTRVRALTLSGAPQGGSVLLGCQGRGCPFKRMAIAAPGDRAKGRRFDISKKLRGFAFPVGTRLTVAIVRSQWEGKYYSFLIRAGRGPAVKISCLPLGRSTPGGAC